VGWDALLARLPKALPLYRERRWPTNPAVYSARQFRDSGGKDAGQQLLPTSRPGKRRAAKWWSRRRRRGGRV